MESECLAYRKYPEPNGTEYFEYDLKTDQQIIELFDYCQILEAVINKNGWIYLINKFGFEKMFELNNKSGWMNCESLSEYKFDIKNEINRA
ncbi:hypothetical protein [Tenacibaculum sp. nBUS_03]|uniref:hypothetical protein n=1 Tax=Tenacibaculum sp. nBUS_03 TaxID=3395320 RepID=UPI003EB6D5B5